MPPAGFHRVFHAGLVAGVALSIFGGQPGIRWLLWIGMIHILLLYALGRSVGPPSHHIVVSTLHRAGFLHTLTGLGSAVQAVAGSWGTDSGAGPILSALGTALLPHYLGVWLGHTIEVRQSVALAPDDLRRRLHDVSAETLRALDLLQRPLENLQRTVTYVGGECATVGTKTAEALTGLKKAASEIAGSARDLQTALASVTKTNGQIATVHRQLIELMEELVTAERGDRGPDGRA